MALTKVGKEGITGISNSSDATAITIDSSEKVGIGTTSPTYQATVFGSSQSTVEIESGSDTGESRLYFTDPSATGVGTVEYHHNGNTMRFQVNSAERMRLTADGLTFNGDTAAANALDDYEEGTFSPTFQQGISVTSYSAQNGRYTKIGNLVTAQIDLDVNVGSANTSHLFIGGLPYTSYDGAPYGGGFISYNGGWYNANFSFLVIANSTYLATYRQSDGGAVGGNDLTGFNGTIRLTAIYIAA